MIDCLSLLFRVKKKLLLFRRQFCGSPSTFLWEDELGVVNHVQQGEGGEPGATHSCQEGELLFSFHDDLHVQFSPNRAVECSHMNSGIKTRLWKPGQFSSLKVCEVLDDASGRDDLEAVVWRGKSRVCPIRFEPPKSWSLPSEMSVTIDLCLLLRC